MENGFQDCGDNVKKLLLLPGHLGSLSESVAANSITGITITTEDYEKSGDELPSTIDMDALKGPPPTDSQYIGWRRSPRVKPKEVEPTIEVEAPPIISKPIPIQIAPEPPIETPLIKPKIDTSPVSLVGSLVTTSALLTSAIKAMKSKRASETSGSSSDSEESGSSSTNSSSGDTTTDSSGSSDETESDDNSLSTKSCQSLPRHSKHVNGKSVNLSSNSSSNTNSSSSNSNNEDNVVSISTSSITIKPTENGAVKKPDLIQSPRSSSNHRLKARNHSNIRKKTFSVVNQSPGEPPNNLKVKLQAIQQNGVTITPISAPSTTRTCDNIISTSTPKPSNANSISLTPVMKTIFSPKRSLLLRTKAELKEVKPVIIPVLTLPTTIPIPVPIPPHLLSNTSTNKEKLSKKRKHGQLDISESRMTEEEEETAKRIKLDLDEFKFEFVETPSKPIEVVEVDVDASSYLEGLLETPSKPIEVLDAATFLPTTASIPEPIIKLQPTPGFQISPTGAGLRKRRKVNRTGFPSVKKKRKLQVFVLPAPPAAILPLPQASTSKQQSNVTTSFTPSLTERIKIRKRNSMDGSISSSSSSDNHDSGISPALLNIHNPPIIIPPKTNYLKAGLLSTYYKGVTQDGFDKTYKNRLILRTKNHGSAQDTLRVNEILPPPLYAGGHIQQKLKDYLLPFDIWCFGVIKANAKFDQWKIEQQQHRSDKLKELKNQERRRVSEPALVKYKKIRMPEVIPESWNFKKIKQNMYLGYNKPPITTEPENDQLCECIEVEFKCSGEDCLNRLVFTECPSACGDNCTNRRIQKHDWAPDLKRFLTNDKGFGVMTQSEIKKGDFILEYVGEVVPDAIFKERMHTIYANDIHHYCLQLDGGRVIDGHRSGGQGRFVNHSCEPNCEMQKWSISGLSRMALFALRNIAADEELSYDYNFSLYNPSEGQPCHCGSVNCRGVIGGRTKQNGKTETGTSKRKSANTKGPHAPQHTVAGGHVEPVALEKMKIISRRETKFILTHHCFLVRNYEKIRRVRIELKDKNGQKSKVLLDPNVQGEKDSSRIGSSTITTEVSTEVLPAFIKSEECEEVIRCICGTYCEEGMMIQCEKCLVWQHCDCMKIPHTPGANVIKTGGRGRVRKVIAVAGVQETTTEATTGEDKKSEKAYYCEVCEPREVDTEILLNPLTPSQGDIEYYLKLQREDGFIVRKNDTVYVLRAWPDDQKILPDGTEKPRKTYLNDGPLVPSECDIFRIGELRKDKEGKRTAFGYNYLRPYETYHEPSRRFYPNELLRAPIMEAISLDLINGRCWVVDTATFCKGRPNNCIEEHLYICDLRVDKSARYFSKVGKNHSQACCTKPYAFKYFVTRLKIQRNLHPHGAPSLDFKIKSALSTSSNNMTGNEDGKGRSNKTDNKTKYKILSSQETARIAKIRSDKVENLHRSVDMLQKRMLQTTNSTNTINLTNV